jgi:hypothetical protein
MSTQRKLTLAAIIVPAQVALAVLAWRDMAWRSDADVRGPKWFWRVLVLLNPGNSVLYWFFARR